jgi:hypothetical protein
MAPHLQIYFPDHLNLGHSSKLFTGVCGLAKRGLIRYTLCPQNPWNLDDVTVGIEVSHQGQVRKIAIDLRDRSTVWCPGALANCDIYFKRSFVRSHVELLEHPWQQKVVPYGLNYPCRGNGSSVSVFRRQLSSLWRIGLQSLRGDTARWKEKCADLRKYFVTPSADTFVQGPQTPVSPAVIFQTYLWEPRDVYPDDANEINEMRAQLVRVLRRRLGKRFWGGVLPTEFACRYYSDVVTNLPTHRKQYIALCKSAMIGVYSRGLHHSNAFKLSEYLAASQAIVSDRLTHELPAPLRDGIHLLHYRDAEECAEKCADLLADSEFCQAMRQANHQYYCTEVEPGAHLLQCLRQTADGHGTQQQRTTTDEFQREPTGFESGTQQSRIVAGRSN